jgi:hypothetical protein
MRPGAAGWAKLKQDEARLRVVRSGLSARSKAGVTPGERLCGRDGRALQPVRFFSREPLWRLFASDVARRWAPGREPAG